MTSLRLVQFSLMLFTFVAVSPTMAFNETEFPLIAASGYPMQHVNPRAAGYIETDGPVRIEKLWETLTDSSLVQPCSSGPEGNIYCALGWDLADDRCNLVALDQETGAQLWEDRIGGNCLFDHGAHITNPLVDADGNLYMADTQRIAAFDSDGNLLWDQTLFGSLPSAKGFENPPFGINILPTGELVTATYGDGWVVVLDRATGASLAAPLDIPSEKTQAAEPRPAGFLDSTMGTLAADLFWTYARGGGEFEVDNNVGIDTHTGLIFVTAAAPAPNVANNPALWALRYDDTQLFADRLSIEFVVVLPGGEASSSTPTVSKDGQFVVAGDGDNNLVAVDIPACDALVPGMGEDYPLCTDFATLPVGNKLLSSPVISPLNRVFSMVPLVGVTASDITRDEFGDVQLTQVWHHAREAAHVSSSVIAGFDNLVYVAESALFGAARTDLLVLDYDTGAELTRYVNSGDLVNITMSADSSLLLTNELNFIPEYACKVLAQPAACGREAGFNAWRILPQSKDQQKCILGLNKDLSKVAKAEGKHVAGCIKDFAAGGASAEACATSTGVKVQSAKDKTVSTEAKKCATDVPEFGPAVALDVNLPAEAMPLDLIHDVFAADLDTAVFVESADPDGAKCQAAVTKSLNKCLETKVKAFNSCKKGGLKGETVRTPDQLSACIGDDPKQKIAKACNLNSGGKVDKIRKTLADKCPAPAVDLSLTFPGCGVLDAEATHLCLDDRVECRVCLGLNDGDSLIRECDLFDDGLLNGSCP